MSQSQPWPLSQKAAKQSGVCSICFATRQIHVKDGTLHQHGPRNKPCLGSNLPPIGNAPLSQGSQAQTQPSPAGGHQTTQIITDIPSTDGSAPLLASISTLASTADTNHGCSNSSVSHSAYSGPIIKHIPRSARSHIATELTSVLTHICSKPDEVSNWATLLEFGPIMLHAPPRAGRRHNLAACLNKRNILKNESSRPTSTHILAADRRPNKRVSDDQSIATAVMSKIEDGNIKAAIRIITSGDCPATDNAQTFQSLCDRHPPAAADRIPSPDPCNFVAAQFTEKNVADAIRSFPAGSAGGPDGVRPQHLRDLTSNKEAGPALVTALTAFTNLLMQGKCPSSVTPIFFGGS